MTELNRQVAEDTDRGGPTEALRKSVPARSALLLAAAAALQITVVMGAMASELGNLTPYVWALAAALGLVQCYFIAELAARFPHRAGGTATYAHEAFGARVPGLGALSSWGYWFAWTPGVAVNLILAAEYLRSTVAPSLNTLVISVVLMVLLYSVNSLGLRLNFRMAAVLIAVALIPLAAILVAPIFRPELFHLESLWPLALGSESAGQSAFLLIVKWLFVATWAAYGAEMASTVVAETRVASLPAIMRIMTISGMASLFAFAAVPFVATGLVGPGGLNQDPQVVFLAPAAAVFGTVGATVVGVMLACALLVGAQAFIIASSRTLYQMACDGHIPRLFQSVNRFGVPVRSVLCDATVIAILLGIFGTQVVSVVASANIGYLVVFVLMPVAFLVIRARDKATGRTLPPWLTTSTALLLTLVNALLLVVGAVIWGPAVWITGTVLLLLIFPLRAARRWSDRRGGRTTAPAPGAAMSKWSPT